MILEALVKYYEKLSSENRIPRYGWSESKISYAIELDENGNFLRLQSLKQEAVRGKKTVAVPRQIVLPAAVKKSSGIVPNFLFGNVAYMLGTDKDTEKAKARAILTYNACKELHIELLGKVDHVVAKAILAYFNNYQIVDLNDPRLSPFADDLIKGANLCFMMNGVFAQDIVEIQKVWNDHFSADEDIKLEDQMIDLITGERITPMAIHPAIKGVSGAQSSGASLISFNAPADCSYGREQNLNAPVGKYASFAYTSAMNYLLSRDNDGLCRYSKMIGDTTLIFWSENAEESYQELLSGLLDGTNERITDDVLKSAVASICAGNRIDWNTVKIDRNNKFYLIGIAPNAARLSIRFAYCNTFGTIIENIDSHYQRMKMIKPSVEQSNVIPLWQVVRETADPNLQNKNPSPQLSEDILKTIITGINYPTSMYEQIELRIRADRNVNWRRASIIKAYFIKNKNSEVNKEVLTVELNEDTVYLPYVLGRLFSLLEEIQSNANPGINATIKDRYFTSACATPSVIFPILLNLSEKHLRKMNEGSRKHYSQQLQNMLAKITETYPVHLTLDEQGVFQLGYYHQTQKRFTKKTEEIKNV
jgi:CRISPR-associated protein Csd1